jgi:hypothetical protein
VGRTLLHRARQLPGMSGNQKTLSDLPDFPEWRTLLDDNQLSPSQRVKLQFCRLTGRRARLIKGLQYPDYRHIAARGNRSTVRRALQVCPRVSSSKASGSPVDYRLTASQQTAQQEACRYRDTHRRYGIVADITAAILHHLLLGFFQLLAFFAKSFRGLTGSHWRSYRKPHVRIWMLCLLFP